ncbi:MULTISPECIES: DUF2931 family protein [Acinetobacter]|uniref:DUF2931 family protein n=1 Tax=Acinetobacter piscicola TaxID=2006115 RepID=A0A7S6VY22_9GAMM|nr:MULTISPECIES: DUF2931 family protein [Acinetobacter]QOW47009.1 DUF2931 family protein [Acinetobacter piscicola]
MLEQANYAVYVGYPKGYISEYNHTHSVLKNDQGDVITHFGGDNATQGQLGSGVQNSPAMVMEVPSKMEVMWFSVTENQFWRGEFDLPKEKIAHALKDEKILDLFTTRAGNRVTKYDQIVVNVAPKGKVYVYLNGIPTQLLATYQAQPIQYEWSQHVHETWAIQGQEVISQAEFRIAMKKDYGTIVNEIDQNYKEDFFTAVRWRLNIQGEKKILAYAVRTLNGEYTQLFENTAQQEIKSIPSEIVADVEDQGQVKRYRIQLNNSYDFYKKHFKNTSLVNVFIDLPDADHGFLYFQQDDQKIEFDDFSISELVR